jgi:hypothetical protein
MTTHVAVVRSHSQIREHNEANQINRNWQSNMHSNESAYLTIAQLYRVIDEVIYRNSLISPLFNGKL